MDEAWAWALYFAIAALMSSVVGGCATSIIDRSPRRGWWSIILAPLPLVIWDILWVVMSNPPDNVRRGVAVVIGAITGAAILFGANEMLKRPAGAQTPQATTPTAPPSINAPNNQGIVTQGQTGGQNIINQAPPPAVLPTGESDWINVPEGVRKDIALKMQNPAEMHKVTIIVHGENLISVGFYLDQNVMMRATGTAHEGPSWVSHETSTPNAVRGIGIIAKKPTQVQVEAKIE